MTMARHLCFSSYVKVLLLITVIMNTSSLSVLRHKKEAVNNRRNFSPDVNNVMSPKLMEPSSRRKILGAVTRVPLTIPALAFLLQPALLISPVVAETEEKSTLKAKITDKIFIDINGLPQTEEPQVNNNRIVIGLFGEDAAGPVSVIKQLVSNDGYPAKCKPREERLLQKEQLEANKVFNSCVENETKGVTYDLSQVWRVSKNKRIDLGAVSGKYIAREYPDFSSSTTGLRHDVPGAVSVRRGKDGGFGFTIYPGDLSMTITNTINNNNAGNDLDNDNIVVGRVLEGMDVVLRMNNIPVIQSAAKFQGGQERAGPSRACRYGSANLYCNELKPLRKLTISKTGILDP